MVRAAAAKTSMEPPEHTPQHLFATSSKQNKNNTVQCHVHKKLGCVFEEVTFWTPQLADPLRWTSQGTPPRLDLLDHFLTTLVTQNRAAK